MQITARIFGGGGARYRRDRLHWTEGRLIGTDDNLQAALKRLEQDRARVLELAAEPENKDAMKAQTARAVERGIVGKELFWGDDRMEQALDHAAR